MTRNPLDPLFNHMSGHALSTSACCRLVFIAIDDVHWCWVVWWLAPLPQSNRVLGSKPSSFVCGACVLFPGLCGFLQTAPVSSTTAPLILTPINRIWNKMGKSIIFVSPKTFIALHDHWRVEHSEEFQIWFPWMFWNQPASIFFSFYGFCSDLPTWVWSLHDDHATPTRCQIRILSIARFNCACKHSNSSKTSFKQAP